MSDITNLTSSRTNFLSDKDKTKLNENDLFDRIINVKIVAGRNDEAETEYVIRSDYEVQYESNKLENLFGQKNVSNKYIIRKCTHKPSIKLQYKMITSETGTEIDLYISNFFVFTSDGKQLRNFTSTDYPITRVEIALGYFGQFKQDSAVLSLWKQSDLFNIEAPSKKSSLITVRDAIIVTTDKLPPDSSLHLHGYVANISFSAVGDSEITTFDKADANAVAQTEVKSNRSEMGEVLYQEITRRFLREKVVNKGGKVKSLSKEVIDHLPTVNKDTGLMSDSDASLYGIKVFTSKGVDEISLSSLSSSDNEKVKNKAFFVSGDSVGATMNTIRACISNDMTYRFMDNGNMLVFLVSEIDEDSIDSLGKTFEEKGAYNDSLFSREWHNKLPAVSNINIDAVSTIVCPFFSLISPFQTLYFATRYALTNNVSYLADYETSLYKFRALKISLSFATVEDVNEMQIMAVAVK